MKFRTVAKKTFSAAMVGTMVLSLAACGGNGGSGDSGSDSDSGNDSKSESSDGVTLKFQSRQALRLSFLQLHGLTPRPLLQQARPTIRLLTSSVLTVHGFLSLLTWESLQMLRLLVLIPVLQAMYGR